MKRIARIVLAAALAVSAALLFSGCISIPTGKAYSLKNGSDKIVSICIYNRERILDEDEPLDRIPDTEEPIAIVPPERFEEFRSGIDALPGFKAQILIPIIPAAVDPNFTLSGYVAAIRYSDGSEEYISNRGVQYYYDASGDKSGSHCSCDEDAWIGFLRGYADIKTDDD
ncbi:MAG: hypothetical protein IJM18_06230 [Clostridia bacterium]|nr:hypothetical protein [Clostridia bacterium]